jgi:hypothetical protein
MLAREGAILVDPLGGFRHGRFDQDFFPSASGEGTCSLSPAGFTGK